MTHAIEPADGIPPAKSDLRSNLQAAKDDSEALQRGQTGALTRMRKPDAPGRRPLAWAGGVAPSGSSIANAVDIDAFLTTDEGATCYGFPAGRDFS